MYHSSLLRAIGLNPQVVRFVFFYFNSFLLHVAGELVGIGMLGMIGDPTLANSVCALILSISCLLASGLVRLVLDLICVYRLRNREPISDIIFRIDH